MNKCIQLAALLAIFPILSFGAEYYQATADLNVRTGRVIEQQTLHERELQWLKGK